MRTNIDIDDKLMKEAMKISKVKSQKRACQLCFRRINPFAQKGKNVISFWKSQMGGKS